jgi:hypothetical protein
MKKLFLLLLLPLLWGGCLFAQNVTVTNLQVMEGTPSTVTFDVSWEKPASGTMWMDSAWVFVDYNKNGKMTRLLISGGTLTSHTANTGMSPDAGKLIILTGNDRGAWVTGDAWKQGSFSAMVMLLSDETTIAGACAYASGYPPVSNWLSDTKLGFTGTPMYEITLTDGSTTVTVEAGGTFLLPCSYTISSFTDRTGAPGIINCMPPTNLKLTASSTTICEGQTVTLTALADGAASYSLDGSTWQTSTIFNKSPVSLTSYTLYAKTAEGCVATLPNAATVAVNPPPDAPVMGGEGSQCGGTRSITATAADGDGIMWDDGSTSPSRNVTATGTYYAVAVSAAGCTSSTATVSVTITPVPGLPTMGGGGTQCGGTTMNITATPGANGTGIRWTHNNSTATSLNVSTGTYYAVTTAGACESGTRSVSVTISPAPTSAELCHLATYITTTVAQGDYEGCRAWCAIQACGYPYYNTLLNGPQCRCYRCNEGDLSSGG